MILGKQLQFQESCCVRKNCSKMLVKLIPVVVFTNTLFQLLRQYFCAKKVQTLNPSTKKLREKLSYKKAARIMLVKLIPVRRLFRNGFFVALTMRSKWTTN
jgi:hypothetical protein